MTFHRSSGPLGRRPHSRKRVQSYAKFPNPQNILKRNFKLFSPRLPQQTIAQQLALKKNFKKIFSKISATLSITLHSPNHRIL